MASSSSAEGPVAPVVQHWFSTSRPGSHKFATLSKASHNDIDRPPPFYAYRGTSLIRNRLARRLSQGSTFPPSSFQVPSFGFRVEIEGSGFKTKHTPTTLIIMRDTRTCAKAPVPGEREGIGFGHLVRIGKTTTSLSGFGCLVRVGGHKDNHPTSRKQGWVG